MRLDAPRRTERRRPKALALRGGGADCRERCRAPSQIEQVDGAAAVVQRPHGVAGGAVIKHNVAFRQPAGDRISATAERNGLDERGGAPNEQLRRAARQRAPIRRREIGNILCRRWSRGGRRGCDGTDGRPPNINDGSQPRDSRRGRGGPPAARRVACHERARSGDAGARARDAKV